MSHYPLAPLLDALGIEPAPNGGPNYGQVSGVQSAALRLGVTTRTIQRWRANGVPARNCDRLACHVARMHPLNIWPDWDIPTRKGTKPA